MPVTQNSAHFLQQPATPAVMGAASPSPGSRTSSKTTEERQMFFHDKRLQYNAKPDRPDPLYARKLQEILGGQWGEITVAMQYLFQGWNCRGPMKYRDMLLDIGTEEMAHVEMLATMVCRLLEGASAEAAEEAAKNSSVIGAILGGTNPRDQIIASAMNPQHLIVSGLGATVADSVGFPWQGRYVTASGNLLADFRYNL